MFKNPGKSLKLIAKVTFWIGVCLSLVIGFMLISGGIASIRAGWPIGGVLGGILVIAIGVLLSWLSSIGLYAFGQLVEDTAANRAANEKILANLPKSPNA